jgi:hypothetical protein
VATIAGIEPTMSMKHLWAHLFSTRENWVVVFASKGNYGNAACYLNKERDPHGCGKRNISGTRLENVEGWENSKNKKIKMVHDGYLWTFWFWLWLKMQKDERKKK